MKVFIYRKFSYRQINYLKYLLEALKVDFHPLFHAQAWLSEKIKAKYHPHIVTRNITLLPLLFQAFPASFCYFLYLASELPAQWRQHKTGLWGGESSQAMKKKADSPYQAALPPLNKGNNAWKAQMRILQLIGIILYLSSSHHAHILILFDPTKVIQFTFLQSIQPLLLFLSV